MGIAIRKFLIFLVAILFLVVSFSTATFAQAQTADTTNTQYQTANNASSTYLNTFTQQVMMETLSSVSCDITGINITHRNLGCLVVDNKTGSTSYSKTGLGALGAFTNLISMTFNPPLHTFQYVNYLAQNFGITKSAYAQTTGSGYDSLYELGLLNVWKLFRDISYLMFVVVFVIVGFAIMLRAKIDPRTIMTIQNQIPKLIIGLILITFSFAIAGFAVDLMWVSTYTVIRVIGSTNANMHPEYFSGELNDNPIGFANNTLVYQNNAATPVVGQTNSAAGLFGIATDASGAVQNVISRSFSSSQNNGSPDSSSGCSFGPLCGVTNFIGDATKNIVGFGANIIGMIGDIVTLNVSDFLNKTIGALISTVATALLSWVIGIVAFFVVIILIFVSLFKLWIALLKAYISIMMDVMFAPFWIISGLLPGAKGIGFGGWLKDLVANLAVFPAVVGLFMLAELIIINSWGKTAGIFVPPLIGPSEGLKTLAPIIAFAFIYTAPHVADGVKKAIKNMGGLDLSAAGKSLSDVQAAGMGFIGGMAGRMYYKDAQGHPAGIAYNLKRQAPAIRQNIGNSRIGKSPLGRATGSAISKTSTAASTVASSVNKVPVVGHAVRAAGATARGVGHIVGAATDPHHFERINEAAAARGSATGGQGGASSNPRPAGTINTAESKVQTKISETTTETGGALPPPEQENS